MLFKHNWTSTTSVISYLLKYFDHLLKISNSLIPHGIVFFLLGLSWSIVLYKDCAWQSTRVKVRHWTMLRYIYYLRSFTMISWTMLRYIYHLRSFTMISCMLLSHGSQAVQTSRFSAARVSMNTCRMWYIERFWKCSL